VDGYPRPAAPASRFRWPAVAADPVQRPCARAVSIAHTETPSEIVETVKWGRRRGDNHQLSPRSDSGVGSSGLGEGVVRMLRDRARTLRRVPHAAVDRGPGPKQKSKRPAQKGLSVQSKRAFAALRKSRGLCSSHTVAAFVGSQSAIRAASRLPAGVGGDCFSAKFPIVSLSYGCVETSISTFPFHGRRWFPLVLLRI
jgi:hypothetical protein